MIATRPVQPHWNAYGIPNLRLAKSSRVRFGENTPSPPTEPWRAYQSVLASFIEKGRPLQLPERNAIPTTLSEPLETALQLVSSDALARMKAQKQFGIAEETSDLLYYTTMKAALSQNVLGLARLDQFQAQTLPFFSQRTPESYQQYKAAAVQSIRPEDTTRLLQAIPLAPTAEHHALLREFLAMLMMDYATYKQVPRTNGNLSEAAQLGAKFNEEARELMENLQGRPLPSATLMGELQTLLKKEPANAAESTTLVNQLVTLTQPILGTLEFNLPNLLRFALYKSRGRTEYIFNNPNRPYEELKQSAKAWEKILEAHLFLTR